MIFDDIKAGNAVVVLTVNGQLTMVAVDPVKEANGMRVIAWTTADPDITITQDNFVRVL